MSNELSSSPCYGKDADDGYMGYAPRDELLPALNELLEAERAGARVALASKKTAQDSSISELMGIVHADEAHWCAMLTRHIRRLGGTPSRKTGAFHTKAMKIEDIVARTAFLNRGQSWVVRKLEVLIPRIRDDMLHADLRDMAERHRVNIGLAEEKLRAAGASRRTE